MKALVLTTTTSEEVKAGVEEYNRQLESIFDECTVIGTEQAGKHPLEGFSPLKEPFRAKSVCEYAKKHVKAINPDVVVTHGMYGWAIGHGELTCPVVNISHGTYAGLADAAIQKNSLEYLRTKIVYSAFEKQSARKADTVVSNSEQTRELNKKHYGVDSTVVHNFVDTNTFKPADKKTARKKLGMDEDKSIGLFVGRQEYQKGFDILEKTAEARPGIDFYSITSPRTTTSTRNIKPAGPIRREQLPDYYSAADFVISPSRFEGFGYVTLEALACNRPIICRKTGIAAELPEGMTRTVAGETHEWAEEIDKALSSNTDTKTHDYVKKNFNATLFRKRLLEAIENTVAKSKQKTV